MGLAGGWALNSGRKGRGLLARSRTTTVQALGGAAKEIAKGGYAIGQLTSEVRKIREAIGSNGSR